MSISSFLFSLSLFILFLGCDNKPKEESSPPPQKTTTENKLFVIDDATLNVDDKGLLTATWVVEGTAGTFTGFEAVIGKNEDCSEVEEQLPIEADQNSFSYQFKNSGAFYLCMFANTSDEQKIAASNNGLKIEVNLPIPKSYAEKISFVDQDLDMGKISGDVTIERSKDEIHLSHYFLYFCLLGRIYG